MNFFIDILSVGDTDRLVIVLYQAGSEYDKNTTATLAAGKQILAYGGDAGPLTFPSINRWAQNHTGVNLTQPNTTLADVSFT